MINILRCFFSESLVWLHHFGLQLFALCTRTRSPPAAGSGLSETPAHSRPPKQVEDYCSQQQSKMVELEQLIKLKDRYKSSHRRGSARASWLAATEFSK